MRRSIFALATSSVLIGVSLLATPAEARRLFWWEADNAPVLDFYGDYPDEQDAYVRDQFNQDEYDLYMEQTHRRHRPRTQYNNTYFDPQFDDQYYDAPRRKVKKKVIQREVQVVKPAPIYKAKPVVKKVSVVAPAVQSPPATSLNKRFNAPVAAKSVDCTKGASIVSGFGFDQVTTKSCSGGTYTYGATRSGKSFEVQVSASTGELTAVKKL